MELVDTLIKQLVTPAAVSDKNPESLWKDILMQPRNKAERLFLLDVDTKDDNILERLNNYLLVSDLFFEARPTPNGMHYVTEPFNPVVLEEFEDVSLKKDGLLYVESLEIK